MSISFGLRRFLQQLRYDELRLFQQFTQMAGTGDRLCLKDIPPEKGEAVSAFFALLVEQDILTLVSEQGAHGNIWRLNRRLYDQLLPASYQTPKGIVLLVAQEFQQPVAHILGHEHRKPAVFATKVVAWLMYNNGRGTTSQADIGKELNRAQSTVCTDIIFIGQAMLEDPAFNARVMRLYARIYG